jgi:hypothetical protein
MLQRFESYQNHKGSGVVSAVRSRASKRSKTASAKTRANLTADKGAKPQSPRIVAKRSMPGRARMAPLCQRRAADWADALRDGLDPDIARFIRDQAAAWQLLADSYAGCPETAR